MDFLSYGSVWLVALYQRVATALHVTSGLNKQVSERHIFRCAALTEENKKEEKVCVQQGSE